MADRGMRQDTMSKIEDERCSGESFQYSFDGTVERCTARREHDRIKIALNGQARLDVIAHKGWIGRPIDSDSVDGHTLDIICEARAGAARECDQPCICNSRPHLFDNAPRRIDTCTLRALRRCASK